REYEQGDTGEGRHEPGVCREEPHRRSLDSGFGVPQRREGSSTEVHFSNASARVVPFTLMNGAKQSMLSLYCRCAASHSVSAGGFGFAPCCDGGGARAAAAARLSALAFARARSAAARSSAALRSASDAS